MVCRIDNQCIKRYLLIFVVAFITYRLPIIMYPRCLSYLDRPKSLTSIMHPSEPAVIIMVIVSEILLEFGYRFNFIITAKQVDSNTLYLHDLKIFFLQINFLVTYVTLQKWLCKSHSLGLQIYKNSCFLWQYKFFQRIW